MNVYVANLVAIVIVSLWNYFMNLRFGWGGKGPEPDEKLEDRKMELPSA